MRNIDIYKKERLIFVKKKYSPMRVQGLLTRDQLIDCLSVVGGLALLVILLVI